MNPDDAMQILIEGNQCWVKDEAIHPNQDMARRSELTAGQSPFAVVFTCVDSRVSPELVFDRGLGDLLVVRTAAHVIDDAVLGSIEFGVEELGISLVVVMGHQHCGAVSAAVTEGAPHAGPPGKIAALIEAIRPAVERARQEPGDIVANSVRLHVENCVAALRESPRLAEASREGRVKIIGARYDLESGMVEVIGRGD